MQRDIVLAVNIEGKAVRQFDPGPKCLAAALAGIIAREAEKLNLKVSVVVVPMHETTPESIAEFLEECWDEDSEAGAVPTYNPPVLFPPNAYDK